MQHRKVLIADDDAEIRRLVAHWLETAGYEVRQAIDGREALEAAHRDCPHFIITDWDMPCLDGLELCRRIRQEGFPHYIYTVLLTGRTNVADMIVALETGADDLLTKPIAAPELLARLRAGARVIELENQLVRLARTDPLTGIPNRWVFFEHFERELSRARRHGLPLACALCDIDFFKAVNDTHGHVVGDVILKTFAQALAAQCRTTDYLCRYGGEEFCVLLTDTNEGTGSLWSERIRSVLRETLTPAHGKILSITASFGVAELTADITGAEDLVDRADRAMQVAKHTGRDRVVRFSEIHQIGGRGAAHWDGYRRLFEGVTARDIMTTPVIALNQRQSMSDAADLFLRLRINSAPVVDDAGKLVGIVSEKDLMSITPWTANWNGSLDRVMKPHVVCYDEDTPALMIYDFLCRVTIRQVVIVRDERPTGMIGRATLLRWLRNWQTVTAPSPLPAADAPADEAPPWIAQHLAPLADGLAAQAEAFRQLVAADPPCLPLIVPQAAQIQESTSRLLALSECSDASRPVAAVAQPAAN